MSLYNFAMDVIQNSVAMMAVELTGLNQTLERVTEMPNISNGATFALSNDLVRYYKTGNSKLLTMNYLGLVDDVAYNALLYTGVTTTGLGDTINDTFSNVSPLPSNVNARLITSGLVVGGSVLRDVVDSNPTYSNSVIKYATHLGSSLWSPNSSVSNPFTNQLGY